MKSAKCIQIYSMTLQNTGKEKDHKIGYQQIARYNR